MRCKEAVEAEVLGVRAKLCAFWNGREPSRRRLRLFMPSSSHARIVVPFGGAPASQRFEKAAPNQLWQMDFKGRVQSADASALPPVDDDR